MTYSLVAEQALLALLSLASVAAVGFFLESIVSRFWPASTERSARGRLPRRRTSNDEIGPVSTPSQLSAEQIDDKIDDYDAGLTRICALLTKAAPLLGLAATLSGVSSSLEQFVEHPGNPQLFVRGFAVAIQGTLWGVFVSLIALTTVRAIRIPDLAAYRRRLQAGGRGANRNSASL